MPAATLTLPSSWRHPPAGAPPPGRARHAPSCGPAHTRGAHHTPTTLANTTAARMPTAAAHHTRTTSLTSCARTWGVGLAGRRACRDRQHSALVVLPEGTGESSRLAEGRRSRNSRGRGRLYAPTLPHLTEWVSASDLVQSLTEGRVALNPFSSSAAAKPPTSNRRNQSGRVVTSTQAPAISLLPGA